MFVYDAALFFDNGLKVLLQEGDLKIWQFDDLKIRRLLI